MVQKLNLKEVKSLLEQLKSSAHKEECWSCDCLQGFLVQLKFDSLDDIDATISPLKVPRTKMHSCLGCIPCPPAEVYSDYMKK